MITSNLQQIWKKLPEHVKLIAVSKFQPIEALQEAYQAGQRIFGENRPQEMQSKHALMPQDAQWHFIGHLQTNKIKYIIPFVNLIHSIDSLNLLLEVNKAAQKHNRVVDCLLEFHVAQEESKHGFSLDEAEQILQSSEFASLAHVRIVGIMGMATFSNDTDLVRKEFSELKRIFDTLQKRYFLDKPFFKEISMGMSNDYLIAIEEGSTMVRIGSAIFKG